MYTINAFPTIMAYLAPIPTALSDGIFSQLRTKYLRNLNLDEPSPTRLFGAALISISPVVGMELR